MGDELSETRLSRPSDTSKAAPRKSGGPKGVNWLRARAMYLAGDSVTQISRTLGLVRQTVSRRCSLEGWRRQRDAVASESTSRAVSAVVASNKDVLTRHDALADKLLRLAEERLDAMFGKPRPRDANELKAISAVLYRGVAIQRAARGIAPAEGAGPIEDRTLEAS